MEEEYPSALNNLPPVCKRGRTIGDIERPDLWKLAEDVYSDEAGQ